MKIAFEYPWVLLLLPLGFCLFHCKQVTLQILFSKTEFLPIFTFRSILPFFVFVSLIVAASGPFGYSYVQDSAKKGRNLILAIDASGSMEGSMEGSEKSKFEELKSIVKEFLKNRHDDNIGIVVFGSFAYIASPITFDLPALSFIIDYLDTSIAGNNTAIGEAIQRSVQALQAQKASQNVIVLITDGHHNSGAISPKAAVQMAKKRGAKIYTIGLGDADKVHLRTIAEQTGGEFFEAKNTQDLQKVFETLDELEPSPLRAKTYEDKRPYFWIFALVALLLVVFELRRSLR